MRQKVDHPLPARSYRYYLTPGIARDLLEPIENDPYTELKQARASQGLKLHCLHKSLI
jgi:hypothetical protein